MRESERRELRRVRALVKLGDRNQALAALSSLASPPKPPTLVPSEQLVLSWTEFHCDRLRVTLTIEDCVQARAATWPSGGRRGSPKRRECIGCPQGEANAFACPGIKIRPPSQAPEVMPQAQRMAKRARALVGLGPDEPAALDPMSEAALASPDDANEWR